MTNTPSKTLRASLYIPKNRTRQYTSLEEDLRRHLGEDEIIVRNLDDITRPLLFDGTTQKSYNGSDQIRSHYGLPNRSPEETIHEMAGEAYV